jgi:hypothetical protein
MRRGREELTVHVVLGNGIVGDGLEVAQLVTAMKLRTRNVDERSIRERNAQSVDPNSSELVDSRSVKERGITLLEGGSALAAKVLAESPLVRGTVTTNLRPPDGVMSLLLLQPSTKVGTVGFKGLPVKEVATVDAVNPGEVVAETIGAQINSRDAEGALLVVGNSGAVVATIRTEVDAKRRQQLVEVVSDQPKDAADQTGSGGSSGGTRHEGGGKDSGGTHLD